MKNLTKNKGITLIALIVTIIVMLILAGITVTTLTGDNGLISRTTSTIDKHKESAAYEEVLLGMESVKLDATVDEKELTLDIFLDASKNVSYNALEYELYTQDPSVSVSRIEDVDALYVSYKGYEFQINGDFSISKYTNSNSIEILPTITGATINSLTISCTIKENDETMDLSKIETIYYSCDDGTSWESAGKATQYVYGGLLADTTYNVKVKIELKDSGKTHQSAKIQR